MKIEQYLCGRKDYRGLPIASNGAIGSGHGCYGKSAGVTDSMDTELLADFQQYPNQLSDESGHFPTVYTKTTAGEYEALVASSYIATGRGNTTTHCYLIPNLHPQSVDPVIWFQTTYCCGDMNQKSPEDERKRIEAGRIIQLEPADSLEAAALQMSSQLPNDLTDTSYFVPVESAEVMQRWNLTENSLVGLVEAVVDCCRMGQRKQLYIRFDYLKHTRDDIFQLLVLLFRFMPYSYRRSATFETIRTKHYLKRTIVFVEEQQLNSIRSELNSGSNYVYDSNAGIISHQASNNEFYRGNTAFNDFLRRCVRTALNTGFTQLEDLYQVLDRTMNPVETAPEKYVKELYFYLDGNVNLTTDERIEIAFQAIDDMAEEPSQIHLDQLRHLTEKIKKLCSCPEYEHDWVAFIENVCTLNEFSGQEWYVQCLAEHVLSMSQENWFKYYNAYSEKLKTKTIGGVLFGEIMKRYMLHNSDFRHSYLEEQFEYCKSWKEKEIISRKLLRYFGDFLPEYKGQTCDEIRSIAWVNSAVVTGISSAKDFTELLGIRQSSMKMEVQADWENINIHNFANSAVENLQNNLCKTRIYQELSKIGVTLLEEFYTENEGNMYADICVTLLRELNQCIVDEWLPKAGVILSSNPKQIMLLLKFSAKTDVSVVNAIVLAMKGYTDWEFLNCFAGEMKQNPELLELSKKSFILLLKQFACQESTEGKLISARRMAEQLAAAVMGSNTIDAAFQNIKSKYTQMSSQLLSFQYVEQFTQRVQELHVHQFDTVGSLFAADLKKQLCVSYLSESAEFSFKLTEKIVKNVISESPKMEDLEQLDRISKFWEKSAYNVHFKKLRSLIVEKMDVYPGVKQMAEFLKCADAATAEEQLFRYGFERFEISANRQKNENEFLLRAANSSVKNLQSVFDEIMNSRCSSEPDFIRILSAVSAGLLKEGVRTDGKSQIIGRWFQEQNEKKLERIIEKTDPETAEPLNQMLALCRYYRSGELNLNRENQSVLDCICYYYGKGKISFLKDYKSAAVLLGKKEIADYIVLQETPEWIAEFRTYLSNSNHLRERNKLDRSIEKFKVFLSSKDYELMTRPVHDNDRNTMPPDGKSTRSRNSLMKEGKVRNVSSRERESRASHKNTPRPKRGSRR